MTPDRRALLAGLATLPFLLPVHPARARDGAPDLFELPWPDMERINSTLWIRRAAPDLWVTCFTFHQGDDLGYVPANGLIVASDDGATIVDTGWTVEQGRMLLATARRVTGRPVARAIATHFHFDRTGGALAMREAGVPLLAHPFATGLARAYGMPEPDPVKGLEKGPVMAGPVELFFPGAGHTRDNITVWHPGSATLYGGCLVKATTSRDLGNLEDADTAAYAASIEAVARRYPERRLTVPGHGTVAGDSLAHTLALAQRLPLTPPLP